MTFDTHVATRTCPTNPRHDAERQTPVLRPRLVYGDGPVGSPLLYDPPDRAKLRVESGGMLEDLPQ